MDPAAAAAHISKTAVSTPSSSPGLFSPAIIPRQSTGASLSDGTPHSSPFLHPLQMHRVRETFARPTPRSRTVEVGMSHQVTLTWHVTRTHKAEVEKDFITGRKLINQYEIIDEIGRGVHGKVKLARSLETGDYVAIKIIQRFSKKRRLGRVTVSPEDKTKREIAILKKIRHANVVGLLEVIDDPELKKIYMVLEHVELGEVIWRKKGQPAICLHERRRIENELQGIPDTGEDEKFFKMVQRRRQRKEAQRSKVSQLHSGQPEHWSLEHGDDEDSDMPPLSRQNTHESLHSLARSHTSMVRSNPDSRVHSRTTSRAPSRAGSRSHTPLPVEFDIGALDSDNEEDDEGPGPLPSLPSTHSSAVALEGTMYGSYPDDPPSFRGRSPSMADSIISHMSSVDDLTAHDAFEDDFSYVPCFTIEQARGVFRDTVLGLEYLHYEGIVHRDIKPANLLWTRDHRVKISDFGVSYFGRPIREGETEENVTEADAQDFDDDLELAKTVGTPAFFAPELCYTDLEIGQPRVTEQIDVWSLGITLYCLIYARIPFMAEDEYSLFRTIATEEVYIPRRRLKPIDPAHSTSHVSLHRRMGPSSGPYREDGELVYEDIDDELYDLLSRMLVKDPTERMKLREVKRHPWVIKGIDNLIGWLDDTDPSRKTAGRRIQVDDRELERAVVPITFLERARSAIKKTVSKAIGAVRSDRGEGSRRRATSSVTSSAPDIYSPHASYSRDARRASLRADDFDYFETIRADEEQHRYEHPLAQSLTASPDRPNEAGQDLFSLDFAEKPNSVGGIPSTDEPGSASNPDVRPDPPDRKVSTATSIQTVIHRGSSYTRNVTTVGLGRHFPDHEIRAPGPFTDHHGNIFGGHLWTPPKVADIDESPSRSRSVDKGLFESADKHSGASIAVSNDTVSGFFEPPSVLRHPRPSRSADLSPNKFFGDRPLASPLFFPAYMISAQQSSVSTPNVSDRSPAALLDERPPTANRTLEAQTPLPRVYGASTPESFQRAQETLDRRRRLEIEADQKRKELADSVHRHQATIEHCPSSPDDNTCAQRHASGQRAESSSSVSSANVASALTSPSDMTSPVSSVNIGSQEQSFASVPSLPALVSSASSDCADPEGEFLQRPGIVTAPESVLSVESSPDTMTPPNLSKEHSIEGDTPTGSLRMRVPMEETSAFPVHDIDEGYNGDGDGPCADDGDDSDSDEGLTMMRKKPKAKATTTRRGTNASVGSTETAKKVIMTE
ncbi:kinase-like protein [Coleophoma crateriformis]|uniref:non-specific serine/threonine protein kinase n=1 Tax=Coleophoma crateriformis TaxID=565419 RepID=A0A3D8SZB0_9HELO|nr:kinase-like protein [Coleophoma crateriformis]